MEREPVKGVGESMRLNFESSMKGGSLKDGAQVLNQVRDQGIKLFNGAGVDSQDGIFTQQEKIASEKVQDLSKSDMDL